MMLANCMICVIELYPYGHYMDLLLITDHAKLKLYIYCEKPYRNKCKLN